MGVPLKAIDAIARAHMGLYTGSPSQRVEGECRAHVGHFCRAEPVKADAISGDIVKLRRAIGFHGRLRTLRVRK